MQMHIKKMNKKKCLFIRREKRMTTINENEVAEIIKFGFSVEEAIEILKGLSDDDDKQYD